MDKNTPTHRHTDRHVPRQVVKREKIVRKPWWLQTGYRVQLLLQDTKVSLHQTGAIHRETHPGLRCVCVRPARTSWSQRPATDYAQVRALSPGANFHFSSSGAADTDVHDADTSHGALWPPCQHVAGAASASEKTMAGKVNKSVTCDVSTVTFHSASDTRDLSVAPHHLLTRVSSTVISILTPRQYLGYYPWQHLVQCPP